MKEKGKKENNLKSLWTLVAAIILFCTCFSTVAQTATGSSAPTVQKMKPLSAGTGNVTILSENFSGGSMPPSGWSVNTTNPNGTWKIDEVRVHTLPYSASVYRGKNCHGLQNEWLITPSLNFAKYLNANKTNKISLLFWWYTDQYVIYNSLIYFNVSVSTDGGKNWIKIWTAKNQSGFPEYTFCDVGMPIRLSDYRNYTNVEIGFQFYSNTEEEAIAQYFAIDDIQILTTGPVNMTCSAGGPYNWWWNAQTQHTPYGVRFHGNVSPPFNAYLCHWLWDFGDGTTSQLPVNTWHFYNKTGHYNITLQVTYGKNVSIDSTTLYLFLLPPPDLTVSPKKFSLGGIKADIVNPGDYNATNVNYLIKVFFLPFGMREKIVANNTLSNIGNHTIVTVKSKYFFGFGPIQIEIIVQPENIGGIDLRFFGFKFGPITLAIT